MKRLSIILTAVLSLFVFTNQSKAQTNAAKRAFNNKFPQAQHINWGMEGSNVYEAEFTLNGTKMSANFDKQGNWKETETAIAQSDLPNAVRKTLSSDLKKADVKQAYKVENPSKTVYEVEASMSGEQDEMNEENEENENEKGEDENEQGEYGEKGHVQELVFTKNGKLVKIENGEEGD